jgi:hypothetical protein
LAGTDLWALQDGASSWTPLAASVLPPFRADPLMLFDSSRRRVVIHGGSFTSSGKTKPRTDTWTRVLGDPAWQQLTVGSYGGRWGEAGVYDPVRDRLVAFGGIDTLHAYADVHVLPLSGGGVWTPLATTGTPPPAAMTQFYRAEYDAVGDRMLVIGAGGGPNLLVYSLTLGGTPTWSQVAVDGAPPRARSGFASAFDAAERQWLVSGGDFDTHVDDVWVLLLDPGSFPAGTSVPPAARGLSFEARPNPTSGAVTLAGGVDSPSTLRIELLDLSGRRVVERTVGSLSPGQHLFRLAEPHALRPGLYFARVSQDRRQTLVKVVVMQ